MSIWLNKLRFLVTYPSCWKTKQTEAHHNLVNVVMARQPKDKMTHLEKKNKISLKQYLHHLKCGLNQKCKRTAAYSAGYKLHWKLGTCSRHTSIQSRTSSFHAFYNQDFYRERDSRNRKGTPLERGWHWLAKIYRLRNVITQF